MHPVRRRKKRPNYGVRSVDVQRGKNGFGFTISGQQPCILSCIVPGSPAENAGLRAGDYLVAVGGHSVSKMRHNEVVQLIGNTPGILKLQIAENYYSDSSDEDMIAIRHKPKYPHKLKSSRDLRSGASSQNRVAKVVRDLTTGVMFDESLVEVSMMMSNSTPRSTTKSPHKLVKWKAPAHLLPPLPRLYFSEPSINRTKPGEDEQELFRAIVGYLGTIEMPRKLPPGSRLQIVRGCIKRLRAEKRTHTAVLMTLFTRSLKLQNHTGATLAIYPGDRVTFCGASSNEDRRHFGVVTTSTGDDPSDSCHVFAVDPRPHSEHSFRSLTFKIECTMDPGSGLCQEFPVNCDPILVIIRKFYETGGLDEEEPVANSPQPSHDSTTTTSNSDSGIGFRDDSGNQSDRILVVDIQNQRLHVLPNGESPNYPSRERLTVRAMPDPVVASTSNRSCSPISTCSEDPFNLRMSQENMSVSSGKSSRKTPDVSTFDNSPKQLDVSMEKARSPENRYIFNNIDNHLCSADDMSLGTCSSKSQDAFLSYKLSPKVFGIPSTTSQSLEDLKMHKSPNLKRQDQTISNSCNLLRSTTLIHPAHWGSLQDLRSIASDCFEDSPSVQKSHENSGNGVTSWATSFEKLLEDPAGLHTFAEFLKKEFSHENIYFWAACERYRLEENLKSRQEMAREIFDKHLALRAAEPVNVDSQARQVTQEQLDVANQDLFAQAQKQIFNLMKFDSYPRFIKSELYKECLLCEISGLPAFSPSKLDPALEIHRASPVTQTPTKLKKSRSDADDRRRKSLLPWSRSRSRCKSRDRATSVAGSTEQDKDTVSTSSSRWSLASWDLALSSTLCRVILPDDATAVVQIKPDQTIRQMVTKLLEKRALNYNCFQVFVGQSTKALSLDESASIVGGQELRIEPRVVFRLDLPNKKTIAVKSKQCKTLEEVVRPILNKYGYRFEMCTLCLMSENQVLEPDMAVRTVDNQRLQVLTRSTPIPTTSGWKDCQTPIAKPKGPSLDEITNRVFEELLQGKSEKSRMVSDQGSVRSEEWSSEHSSSILGRFMRRDSVTVEKNGERGQKTKKALNVDGSEKKISAVSRLPPLIAKWKSSSKPEGRSESDVLYEGLKRAQRSRLEDQRGTEINFELPDFLKDKENAPQGSSKKIRKIRSTEDTSEAGNSKTFSTETETSVTGEPSSLKFGEVKKVLTTQLGTRYIDSGFIDGILPSPSKAEEYFVNGTSTNGELNNRSKVNASPLVQSNGINSTCLNESHFPSRLSDVPPPLPPKPKNLSSVNPWQSMSSPPPDMKADLKTCRMRKAMYLDQPNGSFV